MRCSQCGFENPEGLKFCGECGTAVRGGCPSCGFENPTGFKFCGECGTPITGVVPTEPLERDPLAYTPKHLAEKILQSKSALEGERKQVTVFFADVKGSMDLQEDIDPEEWHRIMDRFFQILTEGVHRFEGTVNQYTGDGIMALFGAPIAHEDHSQRACYAALRLRDDLQEYAREVKRERGLGFSVRMGINSGEVVVGKIGDDLRMDYTAQGHTVGLAARAEELASPDTCYLTGQTAGLVRGYFELEDLGSFNVKGIREPIPIFQLQGMGALRTRLDVSRMRGFSKFVGRADEMATLEAALERAIQRNGQVIGVVGEAGVGKSRLCFELAERCRARAFPVHEAHAAAHSKAVPLLPVLELVRSYFGITEQDDEETTRDKIAGRTVRLDESAAEVLPFLFDLLGVPDPLRPAPLMDPEARQRQLFETMKRLRQARSERDPAVFLIEDLHWIDRASEGFLENLIDSLPGTRTLVLVNFRPEYHAGWMARSYYQQLPLVPLGPGAIGEMLEHLLGPHPTVNQLAEHIRARTGGNPFFIEEVVQSLVESGSLEGSRGAYRLIQPVGDVAVPATVHTVLAARIDRLPEREKQVLQTAAVIGKNFSEPILHRVVELSDRDLSASLSALQGAEFIYQETLYPVEEYAFKHPLTQEVALGSQLQERRRRVHAAVARAIEATDREKLDDRAALLAHHWEEAGDDLEAARWHRRAAERAGIAYPQESFRHWQRVRDLSDGLPVSPERDELGAVARVQLLTVGGRVSGQDEEMKDLFEEGTELARRSGRDDALGQLLGAYAVYKLMRTGNVAEVFPDLERALELADRTSDVQSQLVARYNLKLACTYGGRYARVVSLCDEAFALIDRHPGLRLSGLGDFMGLFKLFKFMVLPLMGRMEEAQSLCDSMLREAQTPHRRFMAQLSPGELALGRGDGPTAVARFQAALSMDESVARSEVVEAVFRTELGRAYLLNREWDQAIAAFDHVLSTIREQRIARYQEPLALAGLAFARLARGEIEEAHSNAEEAIRISQRQGTGAFEPFGQIAMARILIARGGPREKIEAALSCAAEVIGETGARWLLPTLCEVRAELARASGDDAASERELREAHRLYVEMGATGHAERVARELGATDQG
jgi:class 3 adenylate cyclase/tetratricopeptide (TPR) repeat protein